VFGILLHGADKAGMGFAFHGENGEKIRDVEADMNFAIHRRAVSCHVGDIEEVVVRPAGEADPQGLAYGGMRAVASGDESSRARFHSAIRASEPGNYTRGRILEAQQLRAALDRHARFGQPFDEQALVLVRGKEQRIGKRADAGTHVAERGPCRLPAGNPE